MLYTRSLTICIAQIFCILTDFCVCLAYFTREGMLKCSTMIMNWPISFCQFFTYVCWDLAIRYIKMQNCYIFLYYYEVALFVSSLLFALWSVLSDNNITINHGFPLISIWKVYILTWTSNSFSFNVLLMEVCLGLLSSVLLVLLTLPFLLSPSCHPICQKF